MYVFLITATVSRGATNIDTALLLEIEFKEEGALQSEPKSFLSLNSATVTATVTVPVTATVIVSGHYRYLSLSMCH